MDSGQTSDVRRVLRAAEQGDAQPTEALPPLVYAELRHLAQVGLRKTPPGDTLQPTALVHEAFLRLLRKNAPELGGCRHHFFATAVRAMHDILVERARRKHRLKRGGRHKRVAADEADLPDSPREWPLDDVLALNDALEELEKRSPRPAKVVNLRFFAGLTNREVAAALHVSVPTVERDWRSARMLLYTYIEGENPQR